MSCQCLDVPFFTCQYCNNKNNAFIKIQKLNKSLKICNCFWIYECNKCTKDLESWLLSDNIFTIKN